MSDFEDFDIDDILESLASEKSANAKVKNRNIYTKCKYDTVDKYHGQGKR